MRYWDEEFREVKALTFVGKLTTSPTVVKSVWLGLYEPLWKEPRVNKEYYVFMYCDNGVTQWGQPTGQQFNINHDYYTTDEIWQNCLDGWIISYKNRR